MERNVMGELNMHRAAGTKPSFSDIARATAWTGTRSRNTGGRGRGRGTAGPSARAPSSA